MSVYKKFIHKSNDRSYHLPVRNYGTHPEAKAKAKNKAKAKAKSMPGAAVVEEGAKTLDQLKAEVCNLFANLGVNGDGPVLCAVSQTYQNAMYLPNPDEETQPN